MTTIADVDGMLKRLRLNTELPIQYEETSPNIYHIYIHDGNGHNAIKMGIEGKKALYHALHSMCAILEAMRAEHVEIPK